MHIKWRGRRHWLVIFVKIFVRRYFSNLPSLQKTNNFVYKSFGGCLPKILSRLTLWRLCIKIFLSLEWVILIPGYENHKISMLKSLCVTVPHLQDTLVSVYGGRAQQMKFSLLEASEESLQQRIWWGRTNFKMARLGYQIELFILDVGTFDVSLAPPIWSLTGTMVAGGTPAPRLWMARYASS